MNLRDKLKEGTIILPIQTFTQADAIQELLICLQKIGILSDTLKLFFNIETNQTIIPSASGRGIEYSHSISKKVAELTCVLGTSKDGINFNPTDDQLCQIILLTLSPNGSPYENLKFITRFRTILDNPNVRSQFLDANPPNDVPRIIQKWEENDVLIHDIN